MITHLPVCLYTLPITPSYFKYFPPFFKKKRESVRQKKSHWKRVLMNFFDQPYCNAIIIFNLVIIKCLLFNPTERSNGAWSLTGRRRRKKPNTSTKKVLLFIWFLMVERRRRWDTGILLTKFFWSLYDLSSLNIMLTDGFSGCQARSPEMIQMSITELCAWKTKLWIRRVNLDLFKNHFAKLN